MAYVESDFYTETYQGTLLEDENIEKQLSKSSDQIDSLTFNRIVGIGFENLTPFQQEKIKKAICELAEFNYQYYDYLYAPINAFSAGSISVSFNGVNKINGVYAPDSVINILNQTGLTCRSFNYRGYM